MFPSRGKDIFVLPSSGKDGNDGLSPYTAVKTLPAALALATANRNDRVWHISEGNSAALCTDYQSSTLDWNKDGVHLYGVNSGVSASPRSRVSLLAAYATASNLFTVSASNCRIRGMGFWAGVASVLPTGCVKVTGQRNRFEGCHFVGIGATTNDIAAAYSLKLDGAEENEFDHCVIGTFNTVRGAALNSEILFDTGAKENLFENCRVISQVSHASNHVLVEFADATSVDGYNYFQNTKFLYQSANYGVGATGVMRIPALTQGYILVDERCGARSDSSAVTVKWDVNDNNKIVLLGAATPAADTTGVGRLV
jgi:hypothetical protein